MTRITLNEMTESRTLSTSEQKALRGGWWGFNSMMFIPRYNPYNPYAFGYGSFRNVFNQGSFGFGIQAATFQGQARADAQHASFLANF